MTSSLVKYQGIERRQSQRRLAYVGEGLDVVLCLGDIQLEGHIIDFSTEGLGVIVPVEAVPQSLSAFHTSLFVKVEIRSAQVVQRKLNARIVSCTPFTKLGRQYVRYGIHLQIGRATHFSSNERRERRFKTEFIRPQIYFTHPLFFKDTIHLEVIEISSSGLTCLTSIANNTLLPNLLVQLDLYLPAKGMIRLNARVAFAKIDKAQILTGFEILSHQQEFREAASEVIFANNPELSIQDLQHEGFNLDSLETSIKFRFAEPGDLDQVWQFRYEMLQGEEWIQPPSSVEDVKEKHDHYSRHLMAFVHGKLVSVSRLIFNNGLRERSEHANYDAAIPEWLWKAGFVEAGRLLTHRDYRGFQIFLQMLQFVGIAAVGSGYRYAVLSSSTDLERVYLRVGCKLINRFTIPGETTQWSLYYMDMQKCVKGHHVGPLAWWFFHKPLLKTGTLKGWVQLNLIDKIRLSVYKIIGHSAAALMKKFNRRKKQKAKLR